VYTYLGEYEDQNIDNGGGYPKKRKTTQQEIRLYFTEALSNLIGGLTNEKSIRVGTNSNYAS
jgi:hypothetical protein